jgi:integrase
MAVKTNYEKNGIKYYRQTRDVGKDENGKRIRKEFLGHNKKESDAKYETYMAMRKMGIDIDASKQLFYPSMLKWHETVELKDVQNNNLKLSTYNRYKSTIQNQIQALSFKYEALIDVSKEMIEDGLNASDFTYSQQHDTVKIIKKFYSYLISKRVLPYNPCVGIKIKQPSILFLKIPPTFSDDDIQSITNCKTHYRCKHISLVAKEIGLREGELLASEWPDYSFKDRLVSVTKSLTYQINLE